MIVKFVKGHSVTKLGKKIRKEWELRTNQEGLVKIPPIPQGTILVQIIAKNYQTFGQNFDVDEEQKTLDIMLNSPQPQYWPLPALHTGPLHTNREHVGTSCVWMARRP